MYVRDPFYTGSLAGKTNFVGDTAQLNMIPAGRLDPNAVKLFGVYPAPTRPGLANNFSNAPKQSENTNSYDIRVDENFNANNNLFGVYDRSLISEGVSSSLPGLAVGETGGRNDSFPAWSFAVGYTHVFTPTLTNEMHVGVVHADKLQRSIYGNTSAFRQIRNPGNSAGGQQRRLSSISFSSSTNASTLTHIGVGNYTPTLQYVYSIEGADNVTKVFRSHTFKTGVQVDDLEGDISQPPQGRGDFNFYGQYTDIPNKNSGLNGVGDLLLLPFRPRLAALIMWEE